MNTVQQSGGEPCLSIPCDRIGYFSLVENC
jgi:hypothetical protein